MDISTQLIEQIIREQESIIGPLAFEQARKVQGLIIDPQTRHVTLEGNAKSILEKLVKQYEQLFGRASVEVCKEAVKNLIAQTPRDQIPQILL